MKLTNVLDVLHAVAGHHERRELFPAITKAVLAALRCDWVAVSVRRGRQADTFDFLVDPPVAVESDRVADYQIPPEWLDGRATVIGVKDIEAYPTQKALWHRVGVRSAVRIPMIVEGGVVGALSCWSRDPYAFDNLSLDVVSELGTALAVVLDNCLAYEHLAELRDEASDDHSYLSDALADALSICDGVIGDGPAFSAVKRQIEVVSASDATVLLTGESGTGKDVAARAIHAASARRDKPLVTVNCATIPSNLAESELFGHEEGAFTGSVKARAGRFERAHGGTLFLDEVGELPLDIQAKLLRVLQERQIERVGGGDPIKVDVRIIAATNRDLAEMIQDSRFREDLFYRLAVFPIHVPPLRARPEDVPQLVDHFVKLAADRLHIAPRRVTPDVIRRLLDHDWPGNIRELQHAIERAMIVSSGDVLSIDAIVPRRVAPISSGSGTDQLRAQYLSALEATAWVIEGAGGAAARLGIHPNTLRHRLKRLGIARPPAA